MAEIKSESVADFIPESVADLLRNQHSFAVSRSAPRDLAALTEASMSNIVNQLVMKTDVLRQADSHSEIILDWVDRLAAWRRPISLVILLVVPSALWAAILWSIFFLFR